ncbi:hypothetical protein [Hymenobacter rubripertinctus]|uniref:Uncharacterized protein n=1 Tax=Hymenobacter rubripertinctus TaxID=2029981 RepID=A0A418QSL9_9BACT|nr:hypothetical protein [Hymenobacter rubripertinctus]RIY08267.1 hypothetical protein D0T11_14585 [Hymenobacter rubripertinctus]
MKQFFPVVLLLAAWDTPPADTTTATTAAAPEPVALSAPGPVEEAQANLLAARYFRSRPDSAVYLLSTLRVLDAGPSWQAQVKRAECVGILPDNSAVAINKQTGAVSPVRVK